MTTMPADPTPAEEVVVPVEMIEAFRDWYALHRGRPIMKGKARKIVGRILAARPAAPTQSAAQTGEVETEVTYEVWQDDMMVAGSSSEAEAVHYAFVYGQDGPVEMKKAVTTRTALSQPEQSK